MKQSGSQPYKALGSKLKHLREQWHQTTGDVSGTLEIDESALRSIEDGKTMPPVEVLEMLISHFLLTDEQAEELRGLAHQVGEHGIENFPGGMEDLLMKQVVMYLPIDSKVIYTDSMNATVNNHGVVLQFMQATTPDGQQLPVSKVGMSRKHAERMIEVLRATLDQHDQSDGKGLPKIDKKI